mmetsp:Transcript_137460/g.334072  ORF Transcript_137460/g.334072 Transcript_137460/m.334072 type:complete len:307 (+) Transcript_137460:558-1478(+)
MRRLGQVIAAATGPNEHVVSHVPDSIPSALLGARQRPAERGDVLVVPGVAISDGGALGDTSNLVPVVPPRHDAGVLRRVGVDPLVALQVVVNQERLAELVLRLVNDLGVGEGPGHPVAVLHESHQLRLQAREGEEVGDQKDGESGSRHDHLRVVVEVRPRLAVFLLHVLGHGVQDDRLDLPLDLHHASRTFLRLELLQLHLLPRIATLLALLGLAVVGLCHLVALARILLAAVLLASISVLLSAILAAILGRLLLLRLCFDCGVARLLAEQQQEGLQNEVEEEAAPDRASHGTDGAANQDQARHLP